ncbi:MAG: glycoside hydrolase family 3 C-terminal domain-containing protein [Ruminococcus sp.]|nr:glycoside hydrolase family 3 C-terminal domain-containing protein [Ruminococcus sp.]
MLKHKDLISQMTLKEKASLCSGKDFWHLKSIERLGLPEIMVCDGPHGLRKQNAENKKVGIGNSYPATCFPTAVTTACSWDRDLIYKMGQALAEECLQHGVSVLLGPGVNIKRSPLCGRNFEYFSEDPELAGEMGAAFIAGVQSKGIGTSLKHFAGNSQEMKRMTSNSIIDERALREIYLRAFEKAVKKSQPWTVMNAYNLLNGTYCSENDWLQNKVLRDEWGFKGAVISDWGAVNDRVAGLNAGNDLEMPSSGGVNDAKIVEAVKCGVIDETTLDERVDKLIDIILKGAANKKPGYKFDVKAHNLLSRQIAEQSMVLLKNDGNILPLKRVEGEYVAVIGAFADNPRYQGAGSSIINPTMIDSGRRAFNNSPISVKFADGYDRSGKRKNEDAYITEACNLAKNASKAVVFIGLTDDYESEGFDRSTMKLPDGHNRLVEAVSRVNDNVIVVLEGGSPVEMPWADDVKAILNAYLGGQSVAPAIVDVLTGKANPCGKLAETYPVCIKDTPTSFRYPDSKEDVQYRESIFIGYRYYDKVERNVRFPFGFGLSYTSFEYSDIKLKKKNLTKGEGAKVTFTIKNTGDVAGSEIAQVYVAKPESKIFRAPKELKGFVKIHLEPGEEKKVTVELDDRAFAFWNTATEDWCVESGEYKILVGASSRDIRLEAAAKMKSEDDETIVDLRESAGVYFDGDPARAREDDFKVIYGGEFKPAPEITSDSLNNSIERSKDKGLAKFIYNTVDLAMKPKGGVGSSMITNTIMQTPIRNYVSMSNGLFTEDMADGLLKVFEGKDVAKGVGKIAKGVPNALVNLKSLLKSI